MLISRMFNSAFTNHRQPHIILFLLSFC